MDNLDHSRRRWLSLGGIILGSALFSTGALAAVSTPKPRILRFKNINTNETLNARFTSGRGINSADIGKLNHLMRDRRNNRVHPMDSKLFTQLYRIQNNLGLRNCELQIICGYRSPVSNASMRSRSRGVAKNSYHLKGQAIDFRISGISLGQVRSSAQGIGSGGVGFYPRSNFVHIDTGPVRTWRGS